MRTFLNALRISYKNLMLTKWSSFLSVLGVIIGVAAVIIIFAAGKSAQTLILDQIEGVGSNLVAILPGASDDKGPPAAAFGIVITTLIYDDLQALSKIPQIEAGAGYVYGNGIIANGRLETAQTFIGVTADYPKVENATLSNGRFFEKEEERSAAKVAILGNKIASELFDSNDPVGRKIKIKGQNFLVIGVFEKRASSAFGAGQDESVYIPLKTAQSNFLGIEHLGFIRLKVKNAGDVDLAIAKIKALLRERHKITNPVNDDFSVRSQANTLQVFKQVTDVLRYFLLAIGAVSLLVGGVGIMNIMLISVKQRVREVGLRKAIGAFNDDILFQFLAESLAIALIGGIFGIFIGILVSFLVSLLVNFFGYDWQFLISVQSILVAAGVSGGIGVIFGIYPAKKASKISPIEALRYE